MNTKEKKVFKIDIRKVSEEDAIASGIYSIYLFSDEDQVDRIEMINRGAIFKVAYPERDRPFDKVIEDHLRIYPNTDLEVWEKKESEAENLYRYRTHLFDGEGIELLVKDCFVDSDDKLVREKELDENLEVVCVFDYLYDSDKLSKIIEFDGDGNQVCEQVLK